MMICSRPMNTLSTKYSKSCSRVSGVSMVASELVDKLEHLVVVQTDLVEQLLTRCGHRECLKQRHRQGFVRYIIEHLRTFEVVVFDEGFFSPSM